MDFRIDVYDGWLHVASTRKQWASLRKRFTSLDRSPSSMGLTHLFVDTKAQNTPHVAVWIDVKAMKDTESGLVDVIAHEALHVAANILDHIGQHADRHDSEALAYLTGWSAARIWESVS